LALSFWPLAFGSYQQSEKTSPIKTASHFSFFIPACSRQASFFIFHHLALFTLRQAQGIAFALALFLWPLAFGSIRLKTNISGSFSRN